MADASRRTVVGDALRVVQQAGDMGAQLRASISIPPAPGEVCLTAWKHEYGRDPDCRVPQLTRADRRRPGRLPNRATHLIGLLRGETSADDPEPAPGKIIGPLFRFSAWLSFAVYLYFLFYRLGTPGLVDG